MEEKFNAACYDFLIRCPKAIAKDNPLDWLPMSSWLAVQKLAELPVRAWLAARLLTDH